MPVIVRLKKGKIKLVIRVEGNRHNKPHCHAVGSNGEASIDLNGIILKSTGLSKRTLNLITKAVIEHNDTLLKTWKEYNEK